MTTIEQHLAAIEALCNAATPGPWASTMEVDPGVYVDLKVSPSLGSLSNMGTICKANAEDWEIGELREAIENGEKLKPWDLVSANAEENLKFIAAARTKLPQVVAALRVAMSFVEEVWARSKPPLDDAAATVHDKIRSILAGEEADRG